jgi:hypothetical protein
LPKKLLVIFCQKLGCDDAKFFASFATKFLAENNKKFPWAITYIRCGPYRTNRGIGVMATTRRKRLRTLTSAFALLALVGAAHAENGPQIKLSNGQVWPMSTCSTEHVCLDCTFLDRNTCYEKADKMGLINHNIGWDTDHGQRPELYSKWYKKELPLEYECGLPSRITRSTTVRVGNRFGEILCPVVGATLVPPKPNLVDYILGGLEVGKTPAQIKAHDWMVDFVNNVMDDDWVKYGYKLPPACYTPACIDAHATRAYVLKQGVNWLRTQGGYWAPDCIKGTSEMASQSWETASEWTDKILSNTPVQFSDVQKAGQDPEIINQLKESALKEIEACTK